MELHATVTGGLECALCLHGAPIHNNSSSAAVTIVDGYALCEEHKYEFGDVAEARAEILRAKHDEEQRDRLRRMGLLR